MLGRLQILLLSVLTLALMLPNLASAAQPYGRGTFGECAYQTGCPEQASTPSTPTVVTTPSGLEVSINLTEGQTIPHDGYTIVVTPLNGQGQSFDHVDFYIDGTLAHTANPDPDGTARWFWDPSLYPGSNVKIVVTGSDGSDVTKKFDVHVASKQTPTGGQNTQKPRQSEPSFLERIINSAEHFIKSLPAPVANGFPYFLLLLLAINFFILLLQTRRELREYRLAKALLARERALEDQKRTFMELASHYLRTPLTVVMGGIDMIAQTTSSQSAVREMRQVGEHMRTNIELLVSQVRATESTAGSVTGTGSTTVSVSFWNRPGLFVPLILVAVVCTVFDYLAVHAGAFSNATINVWLQVIVYAGLALLTYQTFRYMQLRHRDAQALESLADAETANNQARDELITGTAGLLSNDVKHIDKLLNGLAAADGLKFIADGQLRFHEMLSKFRVAASLHDISGAGSATTVQLGEILTSAEAGVATKATAKNITMQATNNIPVTVSSAQMLTFVLASLLDNAIAYSPEGSTVTVDAQTGRDGTTITVSDHGSGIPADKVASIFQPFNKAEGAEVFTHEGMGFSLYLDKLIMTYLGGTIDLQSNPGKGTSVNLHLPVSLELRVLS